MMAAASYYSATPVGDEATDLGVMWQQALDEYANESGGKDLRGTDSSQWNMGRILGEQEEQLQAFSHFRHDKGRVDKLRTLVSKNSQIIQSVASNVANAASSAFPPSAAILTAFNCVMNASKAVSDDYDLIVQFFDIVNSFLERVSMLEDRIPDMRPFQLHLMKVFKSLLVLCAIARKYRTSQSRIKKWAKSLVDGSDPKLQDAFQGLHTQLQRFEAATQIATLRAVIDSSRKLDSYGKEFKAIQTGVNQTIELGHQGVAVGEQNLAQGQQILAMEEHTFSIAVAGRGFAQDAAMSSKEILEVVTRQEITESEQTDLMKRFENKLDRTMKSQQTKNKLGGDQAIDAGSRKSGALMDLKRKLRDDTKSQLADLESNYVPGTFEWLDKSEIYQNFEAGISRTGGIVHLTGPTGMGKSMVIYKTVNALKEHFEGDSETSVAFFFFRADDDDEARSAESMLMSCAYQVAVHNIKYREELNAELRRDEARWYKEESNAKALWRRLFTSKFTKPGRKVILLLDGVDEAGDDAVKKIKDIIKKLPTTEAKGNIRIMFSTDDVASDELGFGQIETTKFRLDRKRVVGDMKLVAMTRMKRLSRLSKLRLPTRKTIANKLCKKADSIRYVDHMLRRLNAIGREVPILKELRELPDSTIMLYGMLLEDCQRNRTGAERDLLRRLFAWIAYSRERLHMGTARRLLEYIAKDRKIDVDEEVELKSSRILRLSNATWADSYETYESDHDTDKGEDDAKRDDDDDDNEYEDMDIYLSFQERSLREYFRENDSNPDSLRTGPSIGNMMMFEAIAAILTSPVNRNSNAAERELRLYCTSHWMKHLQDIKCDELHDDQAANVINSLYAILSNRDNSLRVFEHNWRLQGYTIFGASEEQEKKALDALREWASRAIQIKSAALAPGAKDWLRPLIRHQNIIYIRLAEAHVANWFLVAQESWDAYISFLFAHASLEHGRDMLKHRPDLLNYFEERSKAGHSGADEITDESIRIVSKSSWQMEVIMTSQSYRAIGMAMQERGFLEASLEYFELSLQNADDSQDKIFVCSNMTETLVELAQIAAEREKADAEKNMNPEASGPKTDAINPKNEVDDQHGAESEGPSSKTGPAPHDVSQVDAALNNTNQSPKIEISSKEWVQRSLDCLASAQELLPKLEYAEDPDSDRDLKSAIRSVHVQLARSEVLKGDAKALIEHLSAAMKVPRHGEGPALFLLEIPKICRGLAKKEQWTTIVDIFNLLTKEDLFYLILQEEEEDSILRKAGKMTNNCQFVVSAYKDGIRLLQAWEITGYILSQFLLQLAEFHRTVVGGPEALAEAKLILNKVLNTANDSQVTSKASFQMADILVDEFRATRDPFRKIAAQGEMKKLVSKVRENMSVDFDATLSQTTIPLVYMTRKLAAFEFQEKLRETFFGCYDLLTDETIGNDSQSLRMLARVLAYVPGLQHDAEIAASCQLYIVDKEIQKKELTLEESEHESDNEDNKLVEQSGKKETETEKENITNGMSKDEAAITGGTNRHAEEDSYKLVAVNVAETKLTNGHEQTEDIDKKHNDESKEVKIEEKLKNGEKESQESPENVDDKAKEEDGDLNEIHGFIICKSCSKMVTNWNSGAVYLCYYCTELDLCEECYVAKQKRESGELPEDWRMLCPPGHKHIKAPTPGWKGVKDGVIRFELEEDNVKFATWLNELKHTKWNQAWENFWSKEMQE